VSFIVKQVIPKIPSNVFDIINDYGLKILQKKIFFPLSNPSKKSKAD